MPQLPKRPSQVGVPRRFGIATLMIFTAAFAVLFSGLKMLGVPPAGFAAISLFVAGIAVCQALLFGGKNPRAASIVGGSVIFPLTMIFFRFVDGLRIHDSEILVVAAVIFIYVLAGAVCGYLAGCMVAGIFVIHKESDDAVSETTGPMDDCPPEV